MATTSPVLPVTSLPSISQFVRLPVSRIILGSVHIFFRLAPGAPLVSLPLTGGERSEVCLPGRVHAVVGNPPYVRVQGIEANLKRRAKHAAEQYPGTRLHGLSDLHVYFWPHASRFIEDGGYLAFLTSSYWLQTSYGGRLKAMLHRDFDIVFLAETDVEPWFTGARVRTVACVARKRAPGTESGADHEAKFCLFRRPLVDLLGPASATDRWRRVDGLLAAIENGESGEQMRVHSVRQRELTAEEDWSVFIRASDLYEEFIGLPGVRPIASKEPTVDDPYQLTCGPILGNRSFFVVVDISDQVSDGELADYGLSRRQISGSGAYRIVRGYEGWEGPVEVRYLGRAARGPQDEETRVLGRDAGDLVLFIPENVRAGQKVRSYLAHGEAHSVHRGDFVQARHYWYHVPDGERAPIIAPHAFQYGWKVWANPGSRFRTTSPNAYLRPNDGDIDVALALLNSTWQYLAAATAAGAVGTEGLARFGGRGQWARLQTIDPGLASEEQQHELRAVWNLLKDRPVLAFPPEGGEPLSGDRRRLDELAIQVAGVTNRVDASEWVDRLYEWVRRSVAARAEVEDIAVANRGSQSQAARLRNILDQAFSSIDPVPSWLGRADELWCVVRLPEYKADMSGQASLLGLGGRVEQPTDVRFGEEYVRFDTEDQADYVRLLAMHRMAPRSIAVPPVQIAEEIRTEAAEFIEGRYAALREALSDRIGECDPAYAGAYVQVLNKLAASVRKTLEA
jgi:Eco57I restriction-modification methylase